MTQALAVLMKRPGVDQNNCYKLLKLLYIAEKESLIETGHPITGDRLVAMPHGPALSQTCNLMRGEDSREEWSSCFRVDSEYTIQLVAEPGDDLLCDYEVTKLIAIADMHADKTWKQMRAFCHDFPEQAKNDPGDSSKDIPIEDIIESPDKVRAIQAVASTQKSLARVFGK
jgi:hypothetical protein